MEQGVPLISFKKGQRKEDVAKQPGHGWRGRSSARPPPVSASPRTHSRNARTSGRCRAGGGDQAAAFERLGLAVEDGDQGAAFQLLGDQHRASDGGPEPGHCGLDQHAVEAEARGPRQVGRGLALAGEPVRPVGVPSQVVEQGPVVQVGRSAGPSARLEQGRAADRQLLLLVERLLQQDVLTPRQRARGRGLASVGEPGVEVAAVRIDASVVGLDLDGDAGVGGLEGGQPRHQPLLGDRLDRDDAHAAGPAALPFGDAVEIAEDALHLLQVGLAAAVEAHAPMAAVEQGDLEMLLQPADAVGDGGRGDPEFGPGAGEALVAGGGLEEAQAFEWGQEQHGRETSGRAWTNGCYGIAHFRVGGSRYASGKPRQEGQVPGPRLASYGQI